MTVVPLPASACVRVRLDYTNADSSLAGSRFYLSYTGSAPSPANCTALATAVGTAWATDLAQQVSSAWTLTEVDVQDIASHVGNFGTVSMSHPGVASTPAPPANCCTNIEFDIARRYRGGKPRMFLPPGAAASMQDNAHWQASFVTGTSNVMAAFMSGFNSLSIGSMGTLQHVNVSYYQGFTNITNSSGRTYAAPKYRPEALVDVVTGYACKAVIGSQRRRRTASTP